MLDEIIAWMVLIVIMVILDDKGGDHAYSERNRRD